MGIIESLYDTETMKRKTCFYMEGEIIDKLIVRKD